MVTTGKVNVAIIELVETSETKHHQEKIMGEDLPFYPSYKAGETLFMRTTVKGDPDAGMRLTEFVIVDIHHSLTQLILPPQVRTIVSVEVYVRKVI